MKHWLAWVVVSVVCGLGCGGGDGGPGESISPSSVSRSDLYGYWVADPLPEEMNAPRRIFAFVRPEDADYELPLAENGLDAMGDAVGAVYLAASPYSPGDIQQITSYEVSRGSIVQTVLADYNAVPGMMYATEIRSFRRGESMVLESDSSPTGEREFRYYERCPSNTVTGWYRYSGLACPSYVATGTALAIDAEGGVHAITGVGASVNAACPEAPTFSDIHPRGCTARQSETPNTRGATSMTIGSDGMLRELLLVESVSSPGSYANDRDKLMLRERAIHGTEWTERKISDEIMSVGEVRLLERDGALLIVAEGQLGVMTFTQNDDGFERRDLQLGTDELDGRLVDAVLTPDERLVIAVDRVPSIYRENGDGFEAIEAPEGFDQRGVLDVHVDAQGRIHTVFAGPDMGAGGGGRVIGRAGTYGVFDGETWATYPLGLIERAFIVSAGDVMQVVVLTEKAARPALALLTIDDDGVVTADLITDEPSFGTSNSIEPFVDPQAAIGPDGTIAATFDGSVIYVKHPDAPFEPKSMNAEFRFSGPGQARITSTDGSVDCTQTCTIESHAGARYFVQTESEPGTEALLGWCTAELQAQYGGCWADVLPPNNPFDPTEQDAVFTIVATPSAIYGRMPVGDALNRNAMLFSTRGDQMALGLAFNPGASDFPIDGQLLDIDDAADATHEGGIALYDRASQQGIAVKLPLPPTDVAVRADGGAQFVLNLGFQYMLGGQSVGPGTIFGSVSPTGAIEVRSVDAQVVTAIVDGEREIALVRDYMGAPYALLIDEEAVPIDEITTPVGSAVLLTDGADVIVYLAERLLRVSGTTVTFGPVLTNVQFRALSAADGRIVAIHYQLGTQPDFGDGAVSDGSYAVEYRDGFTLHAATALPGSMTSVGGRGDFLAINDSGATLITSNNYYQLGASMQTVHQTTFEPALGDVLDSEPTATGMRLLTLGTLFDIGPPAR